MARQASNQSPCQNPRRKLGAGWERPMWRLAPHSPAGSCCKPLTFKPEWCMAWMSRAVRAQHSILRSSFTGEWPRPAARRWLQLVERSRRRLRSDAPYSRAAMQTAGPVWALPTKGAAVTPGRERSRRPEPPAPPTLFGPLENCATRVRRHSQAFKPIAGAGRECPARPQGRDVRCYSQCGKRIR